MTIAAANAAIRLARWAIDNRDQIPADVRAAIAVLAEAATKKLMAGPTRDEIALLRDDLERRKDGN